MPLPPANLNLTALCREGQLKEALHILLTTHNPPEDCFTYFQLLQICILKKSLSQAKNVHSIIAHRRFAFATRTTFHNRLIYMYANCGSLVDCRKVFDHMKERDVDSWNTIIAAYRRHGYPNEAVTLFNQMQRTGFQPDKFTFANVLPACAKMGALEKGMEIHHSIKDTGISSNVVVVTALIDMYAKCGSIDKARELFDKMPKRNVVAWTVMISGYAQIGLYEKALAIFKQMQLARVKPNSTTFASILPACAKTVALEQGYAQNGFVKKALEAFKQMQVAGIKPNSTTFASILPACAIIGALKQGMDIHRSIMEGGFLSNIVVANALVDMYAKCGSIDKARELFDGMPQRDVISWNVMIAGYAQNGFVEKALETFKQMQQAGVKSDTATFASILRACAKIGGLEQGIGILQSIMDRGISSTVVVAIAMVAMYAKCGRIDKAHKVFDKMPQNDVISWNSIIAGYAQNRFAEKALETFKQMQLAGVKPNSTTFARLLPVCAKTELWNRVWTSMKA